MPVYSYYFMDRIYCNVIIILKRVIKVAGYTRARSGITSDNCGFRARHLREYSYIIIIDEKWKYAKFF